MTSLKDIRTSFLEFFGERDHEIVPSSALVPASDPTLLFTNAGMVQFKNVFTGLETRARRRAVSAQKCVRAGGKHNDLDNVGYTARHHTFFEMLGNFSFGDYFKEEAIAFAWELVGRVFALPRDRLWVTVYAQDEEAAALWRKIAGFPEERIIRIGTSDNFWSMGDTGPCGPCSEIFFDYGDTVKGGPPGSPDADGDRFVEFWNLVFMQFDQSADGQRTPLPKPSIDTGMGLERIASILQGKTDNYDTDLFRRLIETSAELSRTRVQGEHAASHRVIADHLRASGFLIADGVMPSNEGRGYVLRRILRRGMRHAHMLGAQELHFHRLVPALVSEMGEAYPELKRAQATITDTLRQEEEKFRDLLERGLRLLDEAVRNLRGRTVLPGDVAFRLYDTFGFPLDLTEDALRPQGFTVDRAGFDAAMERQRAESRASWTGSGEAAPEEIWFSLRERLGSTRFLGYETTAAEGKVLALIGAGRETAEIVAGERGFLVSDQTPFYGESGGQVGDRGAFFTSHGVEGEVTDTQKRVGDLHVHEIAVTRGALKVGDVVDLQVDRARRDETRANHSATHLLHAALRRVLGPHVTQKGSLVAPDRLRFDFSHGRALSGEESAQIEREVNAVIRQNLDVSIRIMAPAAAIEAGALALFGEKYGDEVRVLSMGLDEAVGAGEAFSTELCGGTHVRRLGDIQLFKIVSEGAVGSGVRRIEALTGEAARLFLIEEERALKSAADVLKSQPADVPERVRALLDERRRLERELSEAKKALALGGGQSREKAAGRIKQAGSLKLLSDVIEGLPPKDLRGLVDDGKKEIGSGIVAFVGVSDGKAALAVGVTDDLTARISAVDLVRIGVEALGGKGGGGRPDMAQAGGPDGSKAGDALNRIAERIAALG